MALKRVQMVVFSDSKLGVGTDVGLSDEVALHDRKVRVVVRPERHFLHVSHDARFDL